MPLPQMAKSMGLQKQLIGMRSYYCAFLFLIGTLGLSAPQRAATQFAPSWPPISKEDRELKDNPLHPGDAAMVLYREVQTDNAKSLETHYMRIKIFKEEGKKHADVEIPYFENRSEVQNIQARSVSPDGQSTEFAGAVFDKVVVKTRRFRVNVKALTLPNVQVGSILEYSYTLHFHKDIPDVIKHPENYILTFTIAYPAARWTVQGELFVRHAHFVLRPFSPHTHIEIRTKGLPKGVSPQVQPDRVLLDVDNVPGVLEEEFSPPEEAMHGEVYLFYTAGYYSNEGFWSDLGRMEFGEIEKFLSKSKVIQQEAARLVGPNDTDEAKLRKIYERVQQIRALSFEPSKTEKERERENLKPNKTAEDVLTRGYAFGNEINLLFVALAREAGLTAYPVRVASRNHNFFLKSVPDPSQLDAEVVQVRLAEKTLYLDPATLHCPFGLLPWEETGTFGIRLDKVLTALVQIPPANSADAIIERKGSFHLDKNGNLEGKLEVNFHGQEALSRQLHAQNQDEPARKKDLEEEARNWLPQGATAKLTTATGWEGSNGILKAVFEVEAPSFGSQAGERLLFPINTLQRRSERPFQASSRENPIYFNYGYQEVDDVTLQLPAGYKVESLPVTRGIRNRGYLYRFSTEEKGAAVKLTRNFVMDTYYYLPTQYAELRNFYDFVRTNDEDQAILQLLPGK